MRAEYNAFLARLRAHQMLANKTDTVVRFNTDGSAVRANYLVAFPAIPDDMDDYRYTKGQDVDSDRFMSFDVRSVSTTAETVLDQFGYMTEQLIGHVLDVEGRRCDPIRLATDAVEEGTVQYDKTARLFYVDASFEFWSRRA